MTASSLIGSCTSLVVICSVGEVTGSSCISGLCGQRKKVTARSVAWCAGTEAESSAPLSVMLLRCC